LERVFKKSSYGKETIRRSVIASKHFLPIFENISVEDIKLLDIEEYQRSRRSEILNLKKKYK
jgi:cyanophycinase-like exopeptidase